MVNLDNADGPEALHGIPLVQKSFVQRYYEANWKCQNHVVIDNANMRNKLSEE